MYAVPNVVTAFAGNVVGCHVDGAPADVDQAFSHAVHFRFATRDAASQFAQHPAKLGEVEALRQRVCSRVEEVTFASRVPKDMDAVYRRTRQWGAGCEHLLLARPKAGAADSAAVGEYLGLLGQVAESSLAGSLQSCGGELLAADSGPAASEEAPGVAGSGPDSHALMSRFYTVADARRFLQLPPCVALTNGDERCPAVASVSLLIEIAPVDDSATLHTGIPKF